MTKKPMIEKLSFLLCDVTAKAEMFLDFKKKKNCDHLVLFSLFSPELYVTKLNILIKRCAIYQTE